MYLYRFMKVMYCLLCTYIKSHILSNTHTRTRREHTYAHTHSRLQLCSLPHCLAHLPKCGHFIISSQEQCVESASVRQHGV